MPDLYPLLFEPSLKNYVWGGRNLETCFNRQLPAGKIAESWDISAHPNGLSTVVNGSFSGYDLKSLHEVLGLDLIGYKSNWAQERERFPLLIKLLDAQSRLSVQVHPDDAYAALNESGELGKTEMWVVLHAKPEAAIIIGIRPGTTRGAFERAIRDGTLENMLNIVNVKAGDFVCVPSGTIHAILGGLVIAEVQQNSDLTYRVYDWKRHDPDRPLHIDQALDVINFEQVSPRINTTKKLENVSGISREELCSNRYFAVERWHAPTGSRIDGMCDGSSFEVWGVLHGRIRVAGGEQHLDVPSVRFTLFPAAMGRYHLETPVESTLLKIFVR